MPYLSRQYMVRWALVIASAIILLAACGNEPDTALSSPTTAPSAIQVEATAAGPAVDDPLADLPEEGRRATRLGDPRPPAYWAVWNSCAPENRAAEAAANGGREAGWFLVDDLLADPGIQLGDYPLLTCQEGLLLLAGATGARGDPVSQLAGQLLAAELNLNIGAESCPIAEEAAVGGHIFLTEAGFDGPGPGSADLSGQLSEALPRFIELLAAYNRGDLCR